MRRVSYLIGTGLLAGSALWAGEIATLNNGFQIRAERLPGRDPGDGFEAAVIF